MLLDSNFFCKPFTTLHHYSSQALLSNLNFFLPFTFFLIDLLLFDFDHVFKHIPISILLLYCFQMLVITLLKWIGWFDGIIRSVLWSHNLRLSYTQTILGGISSSTTMSTIRIWNIPPFYPSSLDHILMGHVSLCIIFTLYDRPRLFKHKIMVL
jgi:hypothetical protein